MTEIEQDSKITWPSEMYKTHRGIHVNYSNLCCLYPQTQVRRARNREDLDRETQQHKNDKHTIHEDVDVYCSLVNKVK